MKHIKIISIVFIFIFFGTACQNKTDKVVGQKSIDRVIQPSTKEVDYNSYEKILYVKLSDLKGDGTKENPFNSIIDAINGSHGKTAVLVAHGNYSEGTIDLKDNIHIYGGYDENWERDIEKNRSILDGLGKYRILNVAANNIVDGFIFQNGIIRDKGGAVYIDGYSPIISNNNFVRNKTLEPVKWNPKYWHETTNDGGAIYCRNGAAPKIFNNVFVNNSTVNGRGAAIAADRKCKPVIKNNVFYKNHSGLNDAMRSSDGGAVSIFDWCDAVIEENLFISNTADSKNDGGALFIALWSSAKIDNNIFVDNHSGDDAGALFVGGQEHRYGDAELDPIPPKENFFVSIKGNTFIGNHHGGVNSGAMRFTMESRGEFINNKLANNYGVYFQRSEVKVADNIILDNFLFIETKKGLELGTIENNVLWGKFDLQVEATVRNNNMMYPKKNEGNYSKVPKFINDGKELKSLSSVYNREENSTKMLIHKKLKKDELANRVVNIDGKYGVIKSNDKYSITVWGNFMGKVNVDLLPTYTLKKIKNRN